MPPLEKLHLDHLRQIRVMFVLDKRLKLCQMESRPSMSTTEHIMDALAYIQGYPERWHHPLEDLAFARLLEQDASLAEVIEPLLGEHGEMHRQTLKLYNDFEHCLNRALPPDGGLIQHTYAYIKRQLEHQRRENDQVFPLLEARLGETDWQEFETRLSEAPREAALHRHYQAVFNRLTQGQHAPIS